MISPKLSSMDMIQRVNAQMDNLTKAQKRVANYFLENTMEAAFSTVDKVAHTVGVSTTTVVRLALTLGYSGYAEMQGDLKKYLTTMTAPIHMFSSAQMGNTNEQADYLSIMEIERQNLLETAAAIVPEHLDKAASLLSDAGRIVVTGARSCEGIARYLAYNMDRMFLNTSFLDAGKNHAPEILNRLGPGDVLVTIGFSRYVRSIQDIAKIAKGYGASVIAITDNMSCPWRPYADYIFLCANQSANFYHSPLAAMYICNVLLKECTGRNTGRVEKNLKKLESTTQELELFSKR